jgi:hypothetical protein
MSDERLRQILRQGDPAGDDGGLGPDEARAMRRTVLTAVPETRRRLLPVLALAGAVATAVLIAVLLRPEPAPAPSRIAAAPVPPARPIAQVAVEPASRSPREEERGPVHRHHQYHHRYHPRRPTAPASPAIGDTLASLETVPAETTERQIQFSTPGGTRIIWILKSGKASR